MNAATLLKEARRLRRRDGEPSPFSHNPVEFAREVGLAEIDPWQSKLLRSEVPRVLLNCCRQSGKSTMAAILALHQALRDPSSLVLILAPAERQAKELFTKIAEFYRRLGHPVAADSYRKLGMELASGSRIEALPGTEKTIRGFSGVDLLIPIRGRRGPGEHRMKYMVSADFGQTTDYTAVAVTKRRLVPTSEKYNHEGTRYEGDLYHGGMVPFRETRQDVEQHYDLIRLDRVQLRTSYTQIARGIVRLIKELDALHRKEDGLRPRQPVDVGLAIDEGGVGKAVKDILVDALEDGIPDRDGEPKVIFLPVTVHGGANTTASGGYWHIPKRDLVHAGIVAFQNQILHVAKLRYRGVLEEELKNYRLKQNLATGYAGFEPLREGQHDDLLFATCLGVWAWERAIQKQEYISYPGEWEFEGVPVNVVGRHA